MTSADTASRSGCDEFILVMAEISHPQDAALVADIRVLETPFEIASHPAAHQGAWPKRRS